LSHLGESNS